MQKFSRASACDRSILISLRQLAEILGLIGLEFFDAGFAAKFDLLVALNFGDRLAHGAEFIAANDAGLERVGFHVSSLKAETKQSGGEEEGEFRFHDVGWFGFLE